MAETEVDEATRIAAIGRLQDMAAAIVTGQVAGLMMLATMAIFAVAQGHGVLDPLYALGSIGHGTPALRPGVDTLVVGFLLHQFGFTLFWSLVYGVLVRNASRKHLFSVTAFGMEDPFGAVVLGPLVGMASNLIDVVVVMPAIAQDAAWTHLFIGLQSWCYHLVFGIGLAGFPLVRHWLFGDREQPVDQRT